MGQDSESPILSVWKSDLYRIQLKAPQPIPVLCEIRPTNSPDYFGADYHGDLSKIEASKLLLSLDNGAYLVRNCNISNGMFHTLSLKFQDKIHHYKLYHDSSGLLYVREKRYDCVRSLVADGLVTLHLESEAPLTLKSLPAVNYQESPYMTLNKRKLKILKKDCNFSKEIIPDENVPLNDKNIPKSVTEKAHSFKVTNFKGLYWCELCGNFLWGFTAQGVRCEDCGTIAHNKCSEKFQNDCIPDLKYIRGVFGIDLTTLLTAHNAQLPFVVTKCVAEVEARGLTMEGIYRLSGFQEEIEAIKIALDKDGEKTDLSQDKYPNINVITGALKLYLRVLPIPLITFDVYPLLIQSLSHKLKDLIVRSIKINLKSLPTAHYDTLACVIQHLKRVSECEAVNKMGPHNLATVFAPTLINQLESNAGIIPDIRTDILLIETMITYSTEIFA